MYVSVLGLLFVQFHNRYQVCVMLDYFHHVPIQDLQHFMLE